MLPSIVFACLNVFSLYSSTIHFPLSFSSGCSVWSSDDDGPLSLCVLFVSASSSTVFASLTGISTLVCFCPASRYLESLNSEDSITLQSDIWLKLQVDKSSAQSQSGLLPNHTSNVLSNVGQSKYFWFSPHSIFCVWMTKTEDNRVTNKNTLYSKNF